MRFTVLSDDTLVPVIGQGTFCLGQNAGIPKAKLALLYGMSQGLTLIDTAEDYANGEAENIIGDVRVLQGNPTFIVTKVLPVHASMKEMEKACDRSLARLKIPCIDLYLLHWWRNVVPHLDVTGRISLREIVAGFENLQAKGKIKRWGVSNFNLEDMKALVNTPGGKACCANQVLYSLRRREIEPELLPWCQKHQITIIAYSPFMGVDLNHPVLYNVADRHDSTPNQIALAWIIRHSGMITIPKADRLSHIRQNAAAAHIQLTQEDYAELDSLNR